MPESKELLPGYEGVRGFEVVALEGHDNFLKVIKEEGLFRVIHDLACNLNELGWTPQNAGNISARYARYHTGFTITASGSSFADIQDDDIVGVGPIEIIIGEEKLPIGANYAIDGVLNLYRIVNALDKQGLLEQAKKDLGVEFKLPDDWDYRLLEEGYRLMERPEVTHAELVGPETRNKYAKEKGLSPREQRALKIVYHCENIPLCDIYKRDIKNRNNLIGQSGLTLTKLVSYLGSKDLLKCRVEVIAPKGRKPSSETLLHGLIYANKWEDDEVNAIVHCHAPNITKRPPKELAKSSFSSKDVGYGTLEVAVDCLESMDSKGVLLRNHGPVIVTGRWDEWMPTERENVFVIDRSCEKTFEACFSHLRKLDRRSKVPRIFRRFMNFFNN